jgi:hypothetical protein
LRFSGYLWENMVFEHLPGWETETVSGPRPPQGDGTYLVELLSAEAKKLISVSPQVSFRGPCGPGGGVDVAEVEIHVPLHPAARELVFRRAELELYRAPIAPEPPRLRLGRPSKVAKDRFLISWTAKHTAPLTYQMLYLTDDGRSFSLAAGLVEAEFTADLRSLPGSRRGRLGVLATDGLRSAFEESSSFRVEEKPPRIWIQRPGQDEILPPDQPVTLNGQATDVGGQGLPDSGLRWVVDGKVVLEGSRIGVAAALEPGPHKVSLRYTPGRGLFVSSGSRLPSPPAAPNKSCIEKSCGSCHP